MTLRGLAFAEPDEVKRDEGERQDEEPEEEEVQFPAFLKLHITCMS